MKGYSMHGTTIVSVRHQGRVVMAGDGQVSLGDAVMKHTARKIRQLSQGKILAGFAGSTADALTLCDMFEKNSKSTITTCAGLRSNWPVTGVQTGCCAAGSPDGGRRPGLVAADLRLGRRARTRRRYSGYRLGRQLRPGRSPGLAQAHRAGRPDNCRRSHAYGRRDQRVHQRPHHARELSYGERR